VVSWRWDYSTDLAAIAPLNVNDIRCARQYGYFAVNVQAHDADTVVGYVDLEAPASGLNDENAIFLRDAD